MGAFRCPAPFYSCRRRSDLFLALALAYEFTTTCALAARLDGDGNHVLCYLKQHASFIKLEHADSQAAVDGRALFAGSGNSSRCALVSSSGALLWHAFGAEIDSHDTVIRFNDAPSGAAFTPFVGKKTSVRVSGFKGFQRMGYQEGEIYIDAAGPEREQQKEMEIYIDAAGPEREQQKEMENGIPAAGLYKFKKEPREKLEQILKDVLSERRMMAGEREGRSLQPTMGALGTLLALKFCDYVDLYDMTPSQASTMAPYHYYTREHTLCDRTAPKSAMDADHNSWHIDFSAEKHLWESLSVTNRSEVQRTGKASIPGFSALSCDSGSDKTTSMRKPFVADQGRGRPDSASLASLVMPHAALHATPQATQQSTSHGFLA